MKQKILYWIIYLGLFTSCGDFLEDYSQDLAYASSCTDLEELLIGNGYIKRSTNTALDLTGNTPYYCPWIHVMDDDIADPDRKQAFATSGGLAQLAEFYNWAKNPFQFGGKSYDDMMWKDLYARIAITNVIIPKVDDMVDDLEEERARVKGEALFLRASFYYLLANFYGLPYREATAATDLSIPLKLTEYIEDKYYSRNSVKEVFESIVSDLRQAAELLKGVEQTTVYQANEAAARLLLSRVYLYMERWEDVEAQCDSIMALGKYACLDMNTLDSKKSSTYAGSPETIFSQGTYCMDILMTERSYAPFLHLGYMVSDNLMETYDEKDLRVRIYFPEIRLPDPSNLWNANSPYTDPDFRRCIKLKDKAKDGYVSDMFLLRYPEVILNKAEAQAMSGNEAGAKQTLNLLRENRFAPGQMPSIEAEMATHGDADLITFVRNERRRELCFEGQRWFDLRRYAVSSKPFTKEIYHAYHERWDVGSGYDDAGKYDYRRLGTYRLKKYDEETAYVLPIPEYAMTYNNGALVQNEREERELNN